MSICFDEKLCSGCSACVVSCPKECISMQENKEGFMYPEIDYLRCVNCEICKNICPINHNPKTNSIKTIAYAAYSTDEKIRLSSSSGGIFSLLADVVLSNDGVVFGAAFDEKFNVNHIRIESKAELDRLRGSKYVQSNLGDIFKEVKTDLDNGRYVLFSGVICQIAGLKTYLKKDYSSLLTIDVLCHGVPSLKLWRKYLAEQEKKYGSHIQKVDFRNKNNGWKMFNTFLKFSNNSVYECTFSKDPYMKLFLRNCSLRPSCYDCQFNSLDRPSDISLGDCWGIDKRIPDMFDDKGASVILINTKNGKESINKIKSKMVFKECDVDFILPPKSGGRHSVAQNPKRKAIFKKMDNYAVHQLAKMTELSITQKIKAYTHKSVAFLKIHK